MALKTFILAFIVFLMQDTNENVIAWEASHKLSWEDFKAKPNSASSAVAITASGLTFGFSVNEVDKKIVSFTTQVEAHFYPDKSWYKPDEINETTLAHEQLHFDITELHARKFREGISQLKVSQNLVKELRQLHKDINAALEAYQDTYDTESNFSRYTNKQLEWQQKVTAEIEQLNAFAHKP